MKRIGVIGGGQLAWMMGSAAESLGIELIIQTPHPTDPAVAIAAETVLASIDDAAATAKLAERCDVITFENEFINLEALLHLPGQGVCFRPRLEALAPLLDKYHQRCYLQEIGLPQPGFRTLDVPPLTPPTLGGNAEEALNTPNLVGNAEEVLTTATLVGNAEEALTTPNLVGNAEEALTTPTLVGNAEEVLTTPTLAGNAEEVLTTATLVGNAEEVLTTPTLVGNAEEALTTPTLVENAEEALTTPTLVENAEEALTTPTLVGNAEEALTTPTLVGNAEEILTTPTLVGNAEEALTPLSLEGKTEANQSVSPQSWGVRGADNFPLVLKARRHGYDGQGTFIVKDRNSLETLWPKLGNRPVLLEEFIPFERELAAIAARSLTGEVVVYPVVETQQEAQVCRRVLVPAQISPEIVAEIEAIAQTLLTHLQAVGVFGIELFLTPSGKVLVNEVSPRTHNSGHFSIDACETSQFEMHLRAVAGLPLGSPALNCKGAVMVNLLGYESSRSDYLEKRQTLAAVPGARVHWYGKTESRPGRKLGHVTVRCDSQSRSELEAIAKHIESLWY